MPAPVLGKSADLVWLAPSAESLVALTQPSADATWDELRLDPGCVLLLARHAADRCSFAAIEAALVSPAGLQSAVDFLNKPAFADFSRPGPAYVYQVCLKQARLTEFLASRVRDCDPRLAWIGGLLAPLGWLAVAALTPERVKTCLDASDLKSNAAELQRGMWGLDQAAIARRLNHAWRLPGWLAAITGSLGLPIEVADGLGAESVLFMTVQLAVGLLERRGEGLALTIGDTTDNLLRRLGLSAEIAEAGLESLGSGMPRASRQPPDDMLHLSDMLRLAIDNRRLASHDALARMHHELDALHATLETQAVGQEKRLLEMKLRALAELAAGAGHEINNPLAVISGQAQYLLARETEPAKSKSLQAIVEQANRIHLLLVELMQFARPPAPHRAAVSVASLIRDVLLSQQGYADDKKVELKNVEPTPGLSVHADPTQVQSILKNLLRNAIEAASGPSGGWAVLHNERSGERVRFIVEDSGPGVTALAREHMFDPFFSGRSAGRGRGLGLSTAWKFARQNDGELRYEDGLPTRFVLELPIANADTTPPNGHNGNGNGTHVLAPALVGDRRLSWD